ncbi:phosphoenolpyruvate synthase [bacterium]|jgi:pyruvate, water dikinase|nr:phosphoenolpyruvate synthase [bacterium]MBT4495290.1 phosphoenolpyruvate synthase [bacterium]MBT4763914.1 phosphoenolpyruvate synthase [bacterium]MBT5401285.1 phosphoenolpyruvate synthase [bacterium]MBT5942756.1 phosphoenolpyruvate synthase [bacterium]
MKSKSKKYILWFNELGIKDIPYVGGKNASLGEMYSKLVKKGVLVPNGFAVTAFAYRTFMKKTGTDKKIKELLKGLDTHNIRDLMTRGSKVRQAILKQELPKDLEEEIVIAYNKLSKSFKKVNVDVAVRSSATAEDLPDASFAGQQETYLNITGPDDLLKAVKECIASLFTNRAISYREDKGFDHFEIALSVSIQKMVRSDLSSSGVMFSIHTESGFPDVVLINSSYGLGEYIVKGVVTPDEILVFKPTMAIISKAIGPKKSKLIYGKGGEDTKDAKVSLKDRNKFSISDKEILKLAKWAMIVADHYKKPMDMEWAKDGRDNKLYLVQARPETVESQKDKNVIEEYKLKGKGKVLVEGAAVGKKIGAGKVNVIKSISQIDKFKDGQVLVTEMTDPDWEPIMKKAAAIVTDAGGRTCHAAIVSRELGIPCIVGTSNATEKLKNNMSVTIDDTKGEVGFVYQGLIPFKIDITNIKNFKKPKTPVMMNVGNPETAFNASFIPNEGIGLAREEFIIATYIKIHPLALINYNKLKDKKVKNQIDRLTVGYPNKTQFYIDKLAEGIARIVASTYPKDAIVRLSDFKSNEYANLIGGKEFEPIEDNPMIGWRGASRYYSKEYIEAFKLECKALVKVREKFGLTNMKIMVPFCRTVEEGKKVLKILADNGLKRGVKGLEIYVMCEIPSNVILADEFCKIFDGFSIGTNDLTQLALGVDRDSELVAHVYDERNMAVKTLVEQVIKIAHAHKPRRKVGICGQAPSDFPEFAQFLVRAGIDTISLIPDTVIPTSIKILQEEKKKRK